jgi:hypothetical protein
MSEQTYVLGGNVRRDNEIWRVVRIIEKSQTLFEPEDGTAPYIQTESYVELKAGDGSIDFVILSQEKRAYEGEHSIIKGLEPVDWRGPV